MRRAPEAATLASTSARKGRSSRRRLEIIRPLLLLPAAAAAAAVAAAVAAMLLLLPEEEEEAEVGEERLGFNFLEFQIVTVMGRRTKVGCYLADYRPFSFIHSDENLRRRKGMGQTSKSRLCCTHGE